MIEQERMIDYAVKWWLDYMDGTNQKIASSRAKNELNKYTKEDIDKLIERRNTIENLKELKTILLNIERVKDYQQKELYFIATEQRRRLEIKLTSLIKKELKEKNIAYLYTDEKGKTGGILGVSMELSSIKSNSENEEDISILPKNVDMFVSENKIEVRYNQMTPLSTIFEIDEEKY